MGKPHNYTRINSIGGQILSYLASLGGLYDALDESERGPIAADTFVFNLDVRVSTSFRSIAIDFFEFKREIG